MDLERLQNKYPFLVFLGVILAGSVWAFVSAKFVQWLGMKQLTVLRLFVIFVPLMGLYYFMPFKTWWAKLVTAVGLIPIHIYVLAMMMGQAYIFHCNKGVLFDGRCPHELEPLKGVALEIDPAWQDETEKKKP